MCTGWQVTLCDPIWHVRSRSGAVHVAQTAIRFFTFVLAVLRDRCVCVTCVVGRAVCLGCIKVNVYVYLCFVLPLCGN